MCVELTGMVLLFLLAFMVLASQTRRYEPPTQQEVNDRTADLVSDFYKHREEVRELVSGEKYEETLLVWVARQLAVLQLGQEP